MYDFARRLRAVPNANALTAVVTALSRHVGLWCYLLIVALLCVPAFARPHIVTTVADTQPAEWHASPPIQYRTPFFGRVNPRTGIASPPYFPAQIRKVYGMDSLSLPNSTGAGVTIAIVDAYGDTDTNMIDVVQQDLQAFCKDTGLPYNGPDSAVPTLTEAFPRGRPAYRDQSWALETALDVEWVHAIAPDAHIQLVVAPDNGTSLYDAVQYASARASVVSMSWGGEEFAEETKYDIVCFSRPDVAYFTGSGDYGSGELIYPGVSANVIAVGGTSLGIDTAGNWISETAWSESSGGVSYYEPHASFQTPWVASGHRQVPDVAAIADPETGVYVIQAGKMWQMGGTSVGSPIWAGIAGVLDGNLPQPIGTAALHAAIYRYGSSTNLNNYFHDILTGSNGDYSAGPGYDMVTGVGSPMIPALLNAIVNASALPSPVITSAASVTGNIETAFDYQIAATNDPTSFSARGLPPGLVMNPVTGAIVGVPTATGTWNVTLSAGNASGVGKLTLKITVASPLPPPNISSPPSAVGTVGLFFRYVIAGTNGPTSFSAANVPAGLGTISTGPFGGHIVGIPQLPGVYTVTVSATNFSGTGTMPLTITINPAKPIIVGATSASVLTNKPFQYQITALNNPTSFKAVGLPNGLKIDTLTGLISGTPTAAGVSNVTLSATNVTGTGSANLTITVSAAWKTITITSTNDSGKGSLRTAIATANSSPGSTIILPASLSGTITLQSSLPPILTDMTIVGPGADKLTLDGVGLYRIFQCGNGPAGFQYPPVGGTDGGTVTISGLTLKNGSDRIDGYGGAGILVTITSNLILSNCAILDCVSDRWVGGGVSNAGAATITNCTFSGDRAGAGGAFFDSGTMLMTNCAITNNVALGHGGGGWVLGIFYEGTAYPEFNAVATFSNCTFSGNKVTYDGGGGALIVDGIASLTNCMISGNTSPAAGGIMVRNSVDLKNCTLNGNVSGDFGGGALENYNGIIAATNCTISGNSSVFGGAIAMGYAVTSFTHCTITQNKSAYKWLPGTIYMDDQCKLTVVDSVLYGNLFQDVDGRYSDVEIGDPYHSAVVDIRYSDVFGGYAGIGNIDASPLLAPLGNYGGSIQTMALLPGSPCLGAGIDAGVALDERGIARPQNGRYDIGSFASQGFTVAPASGNDQTAIVNNKFANKLFVTVNANAPVEPVLGGHVFFTAPSTGASATFTGSPGFVSSTGAASGAATANAVSGSYSVTANTGAGLCLFNLTNQEGPATHFVLTVPGNAFAGSPFDIKIVALDAAGNLMPDYRGTLHFTSTDPEAALPANTSLTNGVGTVTVKLNTSGLQSVTATDIAHSSVIGTTSGITVTAFSALASFNVSPASVVGGASVKETVKLSAAAPAGGATVSISSNTAAIGPVLVTIPAGSVAAAVTIPTAGVDANMPVTLSAVLGTATKTASLTVNASSLATFMLSPAVVYSGAKVNAVVSLNGKAGPAGVIISLSSSDGKTIPAGTKIIVPDGATGDTYAFTTLSNAATTALTVTAIQGAIMKASTITVKVRKP